MGVTKAFIKNPETLFYLEGERDRYWHTMASRIQRAWRAYVRRKHEAATKIQRFWRNQREALVYERKRDYGHQVLAGKKERRRFSLLGMRKFMGDYLDIAGGSAQGEMLRNAATISRGISCFTTMFKANKCTQLPSKFISARGRSCLSPNLVDQVNWVRDSLSSCVGHCVIYSQETDFRIDGQSGLLCCLAGQRWPSFHKFGAQNPAGDNQGDLNDQLARWLCSKSIGMNVYIPS